MMSLFDRIQATLRLPAYQDDFQRLVHHLQDVKFGGPDEPIPRLFILFFIETYPTFPEIVQVAEKWGLPTAIDAEHRNNVAMLQPWLDEAKRPARKTAKPIQVKGRRPTRYLELKVDLTERTDVLCGLFHDYVKVFKQALPVKLVENSRGKTPDLDIWKIFDLIEVQGKKKHEIIRAMLEEAGKNQDTRTAYNPESMRLYKQITSAHEKAKRIMKSVTPRTP